MVEGPLSKEREKGWDFQSSFDSIVLHTNPVKERCNALYKCVDELSMPPIDDLAKLLYKY